MSNFPYTVILTGAGISSESGIATFRSSDGLWEQHKIEDVATPEGFGRNPALVQQFYNQRRAQLMTVSPNVAHQAIARLQTQMGEKVFLVTQNVDDLHERSGSHQVLHMHGELLKARCTRSERVTDCVTDLLPQPACVCCQPPAMMRPHIVWFGEMPIGMDHIYDELEKVELFVSIGTSGNVYPAAGFVSEARRRGAFTLELNLEPTGSNGFFSAGRYGMATKIVPDWVELMLETDDWARDLLNLA